jgi:acetyl esterase/lipase
LQTLLRIGKRRLQGRPDLSVPQLRRWSEQIASRQPGWPAHVAVQQLQAAGVPCHWIEPKGVRPDTALLYLHGGGFLLGSASTTHRGVVWRLAQVAGCALFGVDYRLAPEHPFPAALQDAVATWRWLVGERGISPTRTAIVGDSAGAGLVFAVLAALRDAGDPLPAAAVGFSPWSDLTLSGETIDRNDRYDPMLGAGMLRQAAHHYLAGHDPHDPRVSPVYADCRGLPASLLLAGDKEILLDDARRLAMGLADAGGSAALRVWPAVPHAWPVLRPTLRESHDALSLCGRFLTARLGTH